MSDFPVRVLAVLGAAAVGLFGTGGVLRLIARLTMTTRVLPPWLRNSLRVLGALALGSLAALWMFGNGQWGFGGPGGLGLGAGVGLGSGTVSIAPKQDEPATKAEPGPEPASESETVRIEVLGTDALERLSTGKAGARDRRYRVDSGKAPRLMTLEDVKADLRARQASTHPVRQVVLILYRDSPERRTAAVADLQQWIEEDLPPPAKGEKIQLNIDLRAQNAPAK